MNDSQKRLASADLDAFESFVESVVRARWEPEWELDLSPPSPAGGIDVTLADGGTRRIVRVRQDPPSSTVGAPAVEGLADLRVARGYDGALLVTTGTFSDRARSVADDRGIDLAGPATLGEWATAAGVNLPAASSSPVETVLEQYAAYWPDALTERAGSVLDVLDDAADFEYEVVEGSASTEVRCRAGEDPAPVLVRFAETSFRVLVRSGGGYESVVALTAYRDRQPELAELRDGLVPAIESALE